MLLLVVEDDQNVARFIVRGLQEEGWTVDLCVRGDDALTQGTRHPYDLILLDWRLPGLDGLSVLREWRARGLETPVLMLTARDDTASTVDALDAGADDYVRKPFRFEELLARIRAHTRRAASASHPSVQIGDARLDMKLRSVSRGAHQATLRNREFELFDLLLRERGQIVSRARILDTVWGVQHDVTTNVIDVYIRYLRAHLDAPHVDIANSAIETVRGQGYRLRNEDELQPGPRQ